ncbi:MAG: helix-turn-helix domain-containing protein [Proteiniphilum sp.]|nr:helix-turn-helix domain-containing protein [Proteiniphilum sp.]
MSNATKVAKKEMEKKEIKIDVLPVGYVSELARLCGCSRATVWNALRGRVKGKKSDMVRKMYRTKYLNEK